MNFTNKAKTGNGPIIRSDTVLVVIDAQEKLIPAISDGSQVIENISRLVQFAGIVGLPIIVTEQEKLGGTLAEVAEHMAAIKPIPKITFNCFGTDGFSRQIDTIGRKTLILTGVEAHICVAQTALYAPPDFRVQVIGDAIGSRRQENRDIAIARMRESGATITSTEMFIYEILEKAGTDEFKAVLPLVK